MSTRRETTPKPWNPQTSCDCLQSSMACPVWAFPCMLYIWIVSSSYSYFHFIQSFKLEKKISAVVTALFWCNIPCKTHARLNVAFTVDLGSIFYFWSVSDLFCSLIIFFLYFLMFLFLFWPLLQIEKEFRRITLKPLQSTFLGKLDQYTPRLLSLYRRKGGAVGKKLNLTC